METPDLVFRLPSPGDGALKAEIVEWFVTVGDRIEQGRPVCAIETDKTVVELASPFTAVVTSLAAAVGETLEIGEVLLTAAASESAGGLPSTPAPGTTAGVDDVPPSAAGAGSGPGGTDGSGTDSVGTDSVGTDSGTDDGDTDDVGTDRDDQPGGGTGSAASDRVSPMVRRLAEEFGVDLTQLEGSGPGGRITRADVQRAAFGTVIGETDDGGPPPFTAAATITTPAGPHGHDVVADPPTDHDEAHQTPPPTIPPSTTEIMISSAPSTTAHSVISLDESGPGPSRDAPEPSPGPLLTLYREVEVEQLLRAHERLDTTIDGGLPLEALLMRLVLPVLVEHPRMNARVDDRGRLVPADHYDMAFTCTGRQALTMPVVRRVNDRSLRALGRDVIDLAHRAGQGHLASADTGGQTFTVHNLGPLGVTAGTTSLAPGAVALVSYGRPRPTLRLVAGATREVPIMTVGVTVDHRLVDDGEAARFLAKVCLYLEEPILAFTD